MTVLGVDPGMADTGWALVEDGPAGPALLASGILRTSPRTALPERLRVSGQIAADKLAPQ